METPDHASIWRFRQTIDKLGLIVKRGALVDATLIAAAVKRPPYGGGGINPHDPVSVEPWRKESKVLRGLWCR